MAELADALDLGSSGRPWGFKSLYPHQKSSKTTERFVWNFFYCVKFIKRFGRGSTERMQMSVRS